MLIIVTHPSFGNKQTSTSNLNHLMSLHPRFSFLAIAIALSVSNSASAAISGIQRVGSGLNYPAFATSAPGDASRLFVAQLDGKIQIINLNTNAVSGTFLTIPDVDFDGEGGLLGLAFHPDYFSTDTSNPGRG